MQLTDIRGNQSTLGRHAALELGLFGDGSDGPLTFDGTTVNGLLAAPRNLNLSATSSVYTLTRSIFATDLTVKSGYTINTNGFRIFCTGTLIIESTGVISYAGNDGKNGGSPGNGAKRSENRSYK